MQSSLLQRDQEWKINRGQAWWRCCLQMMWIVKCLLYLYLLRSAVVATEICKYSWLHCHTWYYYSFRDINSNWIFSTNHNSHNPTLYIEMYFNNSNELLIIVSFWSSNTHIYGEGPGYHQLMYRGSSVHHFLCIQLYYVGLADGRLACYKGTWR